MGVALRGRSAITDDVWNLSESKEDSLFSPFLSPFWTDCVTTFMKHNSLTLYYSCLFALIVIGFALNVRILSQCANQYVSSPFLMDRIPHDLKEQKRTSHEEKRVSFREPAETVHSRPISASGRNITDSLETPIDFRDSSW